ncbi:MAG: hypothetical protein A2869_00320 [Candidatus Levybacteria bacterium RIFCSPHIGHO2_01_FULL_40_58]|nr:MAG: hypothetical protein A2869_00320 [Candidatus Levybacteria bacterium RIFCSPHIGHO2_01_FULL_40_58]OGH40082.1 MAG: hypothetical protein A2894_04060 [Candidatus Levybacteria bacterium RIFCSPLOWO2_01_FULL_40_64]
MKVIGKGVINEFKAKHADARSQIDSWLAEAEAAVWETPAGVKQRYGNASIINSNVVFNIKGNAYRLWVKINYKNGVVLIKKAGTHNEYMKWSIE